MTETDLQTQRDIGELKADMRTVKHDIANISMKIDGLNVQLTQQHVKQERGLGFVAGAGFIITGFGAAFVAVLKLLFGGHS